ncbi:MAG: SDR family NAD(P)-dependent oxidoreductase [Gemmatimonadaceae bacterium]
MLQERVALVTGASRGAGRGIASALAECGATVYATGRSVAKASLPAEVRRLPCDHANDEQVASVFAHIQGRRDVSTSSSTTRGAVTRA